MKERTVHFLIERPCLSAGTLCPQDAPIEPDEMTGSPYTIRIFVPDGDPEGVRIIDRMNWTGQGVVFPREKWAETKTRSVFGYPGVYILVGFSAEDDDLPTVYIGEGDGIRERIETHYKNKDFWSWGIIFVSTNRGLNKAHVQWLEYALVEKAHRANRSRLDNGNVPQEPALTESEKADVQAFLREILQILPLVGLRAFEIPKAVSTPHAKTILNVQTLAVGIPDTVIVRLRRRVFKKSLLARTVGTQSASQVGCCRRSNGLPLLKLILSPPLHTSHPLIG